MIAEELINNFNLKIKEYFNSPDWEQKYREKLSQIDHDEPWLTLIASYSIFGNQSNFNNSRLNAINGLLNSAGLKNKFNFTSISKVKVEEKLPEIIEYRKFLKDSLSKENFHLYPDRINTINDKLEKSNASFEGNTNIDLIIEGISNNRKTTIFIEAKFLSDISYQIKYNPFRDQISRNIDCGIDYVNNKIFAEDFDDFYFILLTPKVFRTKLFGESKSALNKLGENSSRLYCYKMDEYKDFNNLIKSLPHRDLREKDWRKISENIGWLTCEDFRRISKKYSTISDTNEADYIEKFFDERNLK